MRGEEGQVIGKNSLAKLDAATDFSLVLGGPLFHLFPKVHLAGDALELVRQRIIVISLFTWLSLLVLSALEGQLLGGSAAVPFLLDVEVHVKFLVVIPLLIIAELVVHLRHRPVVKQFLDRNLIAENDLLVIVNRATRQWGLGSEYTDAVRAHEVGRFAVPVETLATPVETFTVRPVASALGARELVLEWERTRGRLPLAAGLGELTDEAPEISPEDP